MAPGRGDLASGRALLGEMFSVAMPGVAFSWIPGTGSGAATATLAGHALGAGDPEGAGRTGWLAARSAAEA